MSDISKELEPGNPLEGVARHDSVEIYDGISDSSDSPPTPDYSPGDYGYPSPGDWDSDYDCSAQ